MTAVPGGDSQEPLILAVAPNGARKTKADHPALPMTAAELGETAARCAEAGAAMIHLHVRDAAGAHSLDAETYREAIRAVRGEAGDKLIIQVTSEAVGRYRPQEQMAMVRELKPEAVSLALREILPDPEHEAAAADFLAWIAKEGILPQFILYSAEEVAWFDELTARGIVPPAPHFLLFVLGLYSAGQRSEPRDLIPFISANKAQHRWALCAFGPQETACAVTAAALGGHARIGFENNLHLPDGSLAPDNAALVAAAAAGARAIGRRIAAPEEARAILTGRR